MATGWAPGGVGAATAPAAGFGFANPVGFPQQPLQQAPQAPPQATVLGHTSPDVDVRALASAVANAMAGGAKPGVGPFTAPANGSLGVRAGVAPSPGTVGNAITPNPGMQMQTPMPPAAVNAQATPPGLYVADCQHSSVSHIVNGQYQRSGEHHSRPVYKKPAQGGNTTDVLVYFWDTRDGPSFSGWYFGPAVGGDQVWAHHPAQTENAEPPPSGWCVPFGGAVDAGMKVSVTAEGVKRPAELGSGYEQMQKVARVDGGMPAQPSATAMALLGPQTPGAPNPGAMGAMPNQVPTPPSPQQIMMQQQQLKAQREAQLQQQKNLQRQQQLLAAYPQLALNPMLLQQYVMQMQLQEEAQKVQLEAMKKQREEEQKKKAEERMKQIMEQKAKLAAEHEACARVRKVMQRCRTATPESIEEIKKDMEEVLEKEKETCGSQYERIKKEADMITTQAQKSVEAILKHRELLAAKKAEEERKKKELEEKVERLSKEMTDLIEESEALCSTLKDMSKPLAVNFDEDQNINDEELWKLVKDVDVKCKEAEAMNKKSTSSIMKNGPELKTLGPNVLKVGQPSDLQKTLAKQLKQIQELAQATTETQKAAAATEVGLKKRRTAKEFFQENDRLFSMYDEDSDGMLSRKEAKRYSIKEFGFEPPDEVLDRVWRHNVEISEETLEEAIGIKRDSFRWLQLAIGVGRELARNGKRKAERLDKERVLVTLKENLKPGMADATRAVSVAEPTIANAEKKIEPLKVVTLDLDAMTTLGDEAEAAIGDARSSFLALRKQLDDLATEGVEQRCREDIRAYLKWELRKVEAQLGRMESRLQRVTNLSNRFRKNVLYKQAKSLQADLEAEERAKAAEERARLLEQLEKKRAEAAEAQAKAKAEAEEKAKAAAEEKAKAEEATDASKADSTETSEAVPPVPGALETDEQLRPGEEAPVEAPPSAPEGREAAEVGQEAAVEGAAAEVVKAPENGMPPDTEMRPQPVEVQDQEEKSQPKESTIRIPGGEEDEADMILQSVAKGFGQV